MKELSYPLPAKAEKIFDGLLKSEWQQQANYTYLASCCMNEGYPNAARFFFEEAMEENGHFKMLANYLVGRGVEADVPATTEPDAEFTDLKSGIEYAFDMEISTTKIYEEAIRELFDIDLLSYNYLMQNFLAIQLSAISKYQDLFKRMDKMKEDEQKEADNWLFSMNTEIPIS